MYPYIELFGHAVQSYFLCAAAAGIAGAVLSVAALLRRKQGLWAVLLPVLVCVAALIGARTLNFLTNPRAFSGAFPVWTLSYRKLSLMGGLIAGLAMIIVCCMLKKVQFAGIADAFAVPAAAGIILLKLGCFLNGCCHGKPTDGPFGMVFPANAPKYDFIRSLTIVSAKSPIVHPTQLYEIAGAAAAISAAIVLPRIWNMKEGSRAAIFAVLFSAARWIILPLRELPYDRQIVTAFYPCLYAALICFSGLFLLKRAITRKQQKAKTGFRT